MVFGDKVLHEGSLVACGTIGQRLASDDLFVPTVQLDQKFRYRARTPFAQDTSEAYIYSNLKDSIVRVTGSSRQGDSMFLNRQVLQGEMHIGKRGLVHRFS